MMIFSPIKKAFAGSKLANAVINRVNSSVYEDFSIFRSLIGVV
jgi:hypothetical protein